MRQCLGVSVCESIKKMNCWRCDQILKLQSEFVIPMAPKLFFQYQIWSRSSLAMVVQPSEAQSASAAQPLFSACSFFRSFINTASLFRVIFLFIFFTFFICTFFLLLYFNICTCTSLAREKGKKKQVLSRLESMRWF